VIFFARYEAAQYGSQYIETEHLLLGVFREDVALCKRFLGPDSGHKEIRTEIEKGMTRREVLPNSAEFPLSHDSRQVLMQAVEECNRLGQQSVVPAHILLGILLVEGSRGAKILRERGLQAAPIREYIAKVLNPINYAEVAATDAILTLGTFLSGLKSMKPEELVAFFNENAEVIDVAGKRWNPGELRNGLESLIAPFANENVSYTIEGTLAQTTELYVTSVLWTNALRSSEERVSLHRMGVVLLLEAIGWKILLLQVTQVQTNQRHPSDIPDEDQSIG
jgi:hypothetical protein